MKENSPVAAVIAYIPIIGWLYVYFTGRNNQLAMFHLRQSIGLFVFLLGVFLGWAVIAWILAWFKYIATIGVSLFALVIAADIFGVIAWVIGILNALNRKRSSLPIVGRWADSLPIR